jgi:hypothetical protein
MDFGLAFSFPFQDEEWIKKLLIAAVMVLIPIVGWLAVFGWSLEITRRVISGAEVPLPPWTDFGGFLTLGLKAFVVGLIFSIPSFILAVPAGLASAVIDADELMAVGTIITFCFSCLIILYSIVIAFALPASLGRLAATDSLGEALNVAKLWGMIRAAPSGYLIVILGYIATGIVAPLGAIACGIGLFITIAYSLVVEGHLYGQAYKEATAHGAA